ncbi:Rha family transcriptional regulator [Campylobacter sp. 9BO]|uniref:Rha family transcriptional regulator n=1 Tax=Campylobacter sp. 9BO TaxID=3424759 RepID=UPI003D33DF8C
MSTLILINNISVNFEVVGENLPTVSSNYIAKVFEKEHRDILKAVRTLPKDEFFTQNFKESFYLNKQNKRQPCYNLTRDGFSLLVMGFTGEKAYRWKIEFIKAFNMMEAELKRLSVSRYVDEISSLNAILINKANHHEKQINGYKGQIAQHNQKIELLQAKNTILKHNNQQNNEFLLSNLQMATNKLKNAIDTFINDVCIAIK